MCRQKCRLLPIGIARYIQYIIKCHCPTPSLHAVADAYLVLNARMGWKVTWGVSARIVLVQKLGQPNRSHLVTTCVLVVS